jgi:16S rRNA (guanine527-N7)-methyltransferase
MILEEGLKRLKISYTQEHVLLLNQYIEEIEKWNKKINLVKASGKEMIISHILDSLSGLPVLKELVSTKAGSMIADLGSGAGLPGIPLSIFLKDHSFFLAERSVKKASFLQNIVIQLNLSNTRVKPVDFSQLNEQFDILIFRALKPLGRSLKPLKKLLKTDGIIVAYKGRLKTVLAETRRIKEIFPQVKIIPLSVPFLNRERHIVLLKA